ncbi:glycosyltransferase family 2 protein [Sphingobacterium wenxiniae]|nr:glycosyltransferase family 2 protein [Sphingobacterium wenxiniae]
MVPKVSVITPNYNHAPYLKERIDSVLNQTYQDIEVIILDDCSTDGSREIIEGYRNHPHVTNIVFNKSNSGSTFKQWEKGIELAQGEWVWIAESDDWCESNFLEELMYHIGRSEEQLSIAFCQSYYYYMETGLLRTLELPRKLVQIISKDFFIQERLLPNNLIMNASMAIFKRELYWEVSPYYKDFRFCGDWVFWAELSLLGDVLELGKHLNYFRKHGRDVTGKVNKSGYNFIEELKALTYFKNVLRAPKEYINESLVQRYDKFQKRKSSLEDHVVDEIQASFETVMDGGMLKDMQNRYRNENRFRKLKGLLSRLRGIGR